MKITKIKTKQEAVPFPNNSSVFPATFLNFVSPTVGLSRQYHELCQYPDGFHGNTDTPVQYATVGQDLPKLSLFYVLPPIAVHTRRSIFPAQCSIHCART